MRTYKEHKTLILNHSIILKDDQRGKVVFTVRGGTGLRIDFTGVAFIDDHAAIALAGDDQYIVDNIHDSMSPLLGAEYFDVTQDDEEDFIVTPLIPGIMDELVAYSDNDILFVDTLYDAISEHKALLGICRVLNSKGFKQVLWDVLVDGGCDEYYPLDSNDLDDAGI